MNKKSLLPKLAFTGICKNMTTYLPYIIVSIFAVFTYFSFDLILKNDIMQTLPKAFYAKLMISIGFFLLGLIMIPFLYYTNSFLVKQRKKELGLYSILGMEKKHIGMMMFFETLIIYLLVTAAGILTGLLFSKLVFLLLLNLVKIPVDARFSISPKAIGDTLIFYALVSLLNLFSNLFQVGRANPAELMGEAKKGEKEIRFTKLWSLAGLFCISCGYYLAVVSEIDSMIFLNFFLAVLLVIAGTYFLFTSGSITFLKALKKNSRIYYRKENLIMISGMLYRMKKNAAGLSNICIFATMSIITVICTVTLYLGIPGIKDFMYPFDAKLDFADAGEDKKEEWHRMVKNAAVKSGVSDFVDIGCTYTEVWALLENGRVLPEKTDLKTGESQHFYFMTLESLNEMEGSNRTLTPGEAFLFSSGADYGLSSITFMEQEYQIKEELQELKIEPKAKSNRLSHRYWIILPGREEILDIITAYHADPLIRYQIFCNTGGGSSETKEFCRLLLEVFGETAELTDFQDYTDFQDGVEAMCGGLLFIGIFFGLIFMICLLIIMYYKQITEGFEDQSSFEIMQKVGMSDDEVRKTIKTQILMVFFLPLLGAVLHTAFGLNMVIKLMGVLYFYQTGLIMMSAAIICLIFTVLYIYCYLQTSKTYYRIVRRMS